MTVKYTVKTATFVVIIQLFCGVDLFKVTIKYTMQTATFVVTVHQYFEA